MEEGCGQTHRQTETKVIVYQMHLVDYLITLISVGLSVCLSTDRLSNYYVRNPLPIFTTFCTPLGDLVVSKAIVYETNWKQSTDFRDVQNPILAVS